MSSGTFFSTEKALTLQLLQQPLMRHLIESLGKIQIYHIYAPAIAISSVTLSKQVSKLVKHDISFLEPCFVPDSTEINIY